MKRYRLISLVLIAALLEGMVMAFVTPPTAVAIAAALRVPAIASMLSETATPDPDAMPSYEFQPDELKVSACKTGGDALVTANLRNTASEDKDIALGVKLGYVVDRGANYVSSVSLEPSSFDQIDPREEVHFKVHVTTTEEFLGTSDEIKVRVFVASAINRPDHLNGRVTVTVTGGCPNRTATPITTKTVTPEPPTITPEPPTITPEPPVEYYCLTTGSAGDMYLNNFDDAAPGPLGWSTYKADTAPAGQHFMGQLGNETLTLNMACLPEHNIVHLEFDLYIIRSWEGSSSTQGPDVWDLAVNGRSVIHTTFTNYPDGTQAFPNNYPDAVNTGPIGVVAMNTLGYTVNGTAMDSVYHISVDVRHITPEITIDFSGLGLQDLADESWGVDNFSAEALYYPAPIYFPMMMLNGK